MSDLQRKVLEDLDSIETHWCPWCPVGLIHVERIDRENYPGVVVICRCPSCGQQVHDLMDTDCWCIK